MTVATTTTDPTGASMLWDAIQAVITGPVGGVWTITAPDDVTQATLDQNVADATAAAIAEANRLALLAKAAAALVANATFLALAAPTNVQVLAQTKSLTRQSNAVIKLLTEQLADTSGT